MGNSDSPFQSAITAFFAAEQSEARRVFHGRGQCFPGFEHLCLDWYPPLLLISAYDVIENRAALLDLILGSDLQQQIASVVVQQRHAHGAPAETVYGVTQESIIVTENGLRFEVHPGRRQNAGLFLDMRLVRRWLMDNSAGKNVLNLFAYTCSLSVAALAGSASSVTNVDVSKTSIAWGIRNHQLNGQSPERVRSIPYNLFTSWGRVRQFGRYDMVLIDPPSRQRGSFEAEKDYAAVVKRLSGLCNPGAEVIACLNSPFLDSDWLVALFNKHCSEATLLDGPPVAPEFPDEQPQRGLKICRFRIAGG